MKKKTVVIISNDPVWTYNLRREIIQALLNGGYNVTIIVGNGKKIDALQEMGCDFIDIPVNRHGKNPFHELILLKKYHRTLKELKPDVVLTYTIKPNVYGGYVCGRLNIPFIANITGFGTVIGNEGLLQKVVTQMLRAGLARASMVFFQNTENMKFLTENNVIRGRCDLLPGSGVNTAHFHVLPYPTDDGVHFVFISRIMKEKGIDQYLEAAEVIHEKYPQTHFHICGFCEQAYEERISELSKKGIVCYHGMVDDIREILKQTHCTVHPTYYPEGLSNVLLESSACGRPIITTDRPGCREVIDDGVNGFIVNEKDSTDLIEKLERFIQLSHEQKEQMGLCGREKVESEFDRSIVVSKYMAEVSELTKSKE